MKPVIGLLVEVNGELDVKIQNTYIKAIEGAGGLPIIFPYVVKTETIDDFLDLCDGIIFTGGADVDPKRYGEEVREVCGRIEYSRDDIEFRVFSRLIERDMPVLAICRGSQLTNVALGGTLYQDIPTDTGTEMKHKQEEPKFSLSHEVEVVEGTPLYDLTGAKRIRVNSFHHQAIKDMAEGISVMARADDGIIEAFYLPRKRYFHAYQWHPERLCEIDEYSRRIFEDFIAACGEK